jgi:hypothetical protein
LVLIEQSFDPRTKPDIWVINGPAMAASLSQHGNSLESLVENIGGTEEEVLDAITRMFATFECLCDFLGVPKEEVTPEEPLPC